MNPWLLTVWLVCAAASLILAFLPEPLPISDYGDKMIHMASCALLLAFPAMAFRRFRDIMLVASLVMAAGLGVEAVQHLMPGRRSEWQDLLADGAGIALGIWIGLLLRGGYRALAEEGNK